MRTLLALLALGCGGSRAPAEPRPAGLDGLWGGELALDVGPAGTLELADTRATLGGATTAVETEGDTLRGAFGDTRFRVHRDGARLAGHWIQRRTILDSAYATPLALERGADGRYRGRVEPVPSALRIFVMIDGARAYLREPSRNLGKIFGWLAVAPTATGFLLRDHDGKVFATATRTGDKLHLAFEGEPVAVDLARRGRDAIGFYARPPGPVYLAPPATDGDWPVEAPDRAGFDPAALEAIVADLARDVPDGPSTRAVHALLIARRGKLVVEEYFAGHTAGALHDLRSAGKSISTTLAGAAIDRGELTLDSPLYETVGAAPDDPRKRDIRLVHLVSMATGLACNDWDDASPGNEDRMQNQDAQPDWYRFILDLPVANPPGTAAYCSGTMNLVGAMLGARTHQWLPDLVARDFMAPLGIAHYALPLQPGDEGYFGGGVRLRARDFAKLAQLFLDGGTWHGRRVVGEAWTRAATAAHVTLTTANDYGYGWWRKTYGDAEAFYASGNGGQIAMAIPKHQLVIVFQAGNYNAAPIWKRQLEETVPAILRALR